MLEKVVNLDNLGVFKKGAPKALPFEKATLIYAENARGKSTLSAVLQACSTGDAAAVEARATIGGTAKPKIHFRFLTNGTGTGVIFDAGKWQAAEPRVLVFDQGFVERNVYAGSEVSPDHHQALLDFALGSAAVAKKVEVDQRGSDQVNATKRRTAAEEKLKGYRGAMTLADFLTLTLDPKIDEAIAMLTRRINDAKEAKNLGARPSPREITLPTVDFDEFSHTASKTLKGIHEGAEKIVKTHLAKIGGHGSAQWLSTGHALVKDDDCPFCGQNVVGVELVEAYKTHFDHEYAKHSTRVAGLASVAAGVLPDAFFASLSATCEANADRIEAWKPQLVLPAPALDFAGLTAAASEVRDAMSKVAAAKLQSPLEPVDLSGLDKALASFAGVCEALNTYNTQVSAANVQIGIFKKTLASEKVESLEQDLQKAQLRKIRHTQDVIQIVDERMQADTDRATAETAKAKARAVLDALMNAVLESFQKGINDWLAKFGAPFTIDKLKANYLGGGAPRTGYGIVLRGNTVVAGKKAASAPCFQTALSEGDKRTLAFALFLARLFDDKEPDKKIVVLDDVFTSLDKHRRAQTVETTGRIAKTCAQVIVLGHDGYFLRQLSRHLHDKKICAQVSLQMRRVADNFSELDEIDLEELCASEYYKRYRDLQDFIDGKATTGLLAVAQGLRPLVEGHLHRRFPGFIKEGVTFGVVLDQIKNAPGTSPLAVLAPYVKELGNLNDFASQFHHDTTGKVPRQDVTDSELMVFGKSAMRLIQTGVL